MFAGYSSAPKKEVLWICDRCESTLLATKAELVYHKWRTYAGGKPLLCPDCQPKQGSK